VHYPGRDVDRIVHIEQATDAKAAIDYANIFIDAVRQNVVDP